MPVQRRSTSEKIQLFQSLFCGLGHVYGTLDTKTGKVRQVKAPVTEDVIYAHLMGHSPYGVYLLVHDRTRALAVDFDDHDLEKPKAFVCHARTLGLPFYIERSKSKGFHVWAFFAQEGVQALKARSLAHGILQDLHLKQVEVFPKQDRLDSRISYGNFINAPLFGQYVAHGRTVFVEPEDPTRQCSDQWGLLESIERISEARLDDIQRKQGYVNSDDNARRSGETIGTGSEIKGGGSFGLPVCARRMLRKGVDVCQRVACFRLAVNLHKVGLPQDIAVGALMAWARKNRPDNGRRIITDHEIRQQVACAYDREYKGLGCEEHVVNRFCDPQCPVLTKPDEGYRQKTIGGDHV